MKLQKALPLVGAALAALASPSTAAECYRASPEAITVTDWTIDPVDATTNTLTVTFRSNLDRSIRMIDGMIYFTDALGQDIGPMTMDRDLTIDPGETYTQDGLWGPYTFERLLVLRHDEVQATACVSAVLYDDGTKETFD